MTQPVAAVPLTIFGPGSPSVQCPIDAAAIIYAGSAVSIRSTGFARQLNSSTPDAIFGGFAARTANNTTGWVNGNTLPPTDGVAGSAVVELIETGKVQLTIGGSLTGNDSDRGTVVYATDGQVFTTSSASNAIKIGVIDQYVSAGVYVVTFRASSAVKS